MNIYLFIIVAGTTIIGWIWFFYEKYSNQNNYNLSITLTKYFENNNVNIKYIDEYINQFWTNDGIFKSEHKNRTVYLITKSELNELNSLYVHEKHIVDLNRSHWDKPIYTSNNSNFDRIIKQIKNR